MPRTAADVLQERDVTVLRRRGTKCTFYYRLEDGRPVERAVHDDGRIGGVYDAGHLGNISSADVERVDEDAWPAEGS